MQTIRKRLSILFFICSILSILMITLFVNITINDKFNNYLVDNQDKRYQRIVSYFQEIYKKEGQWNLSSGKELRHEAYMGNYCLTLLNKEKQVIWGMDPDDLQNRLHLKTMAVDRGDYSTQTYEIKSKDEIIGYVEIGQYESILMSEEDINFKSSINKSIVASGFLALIIIMGVSLYFSKHFSDPIKEVANLSIELSKGNFQTKSITESNIEELENLRTSVNILADKLKTQDDIRKRLVSDISHEIRTPLNILQNNLEAMIDGVFPVTTERLNSLNEEVVRFGMLLNNLNKLKEFESESTKMNYETIYLDVLLTDIVEDFKMALNTKKNKLIYDKGKNYQINGDKDKIKQVFINLMTNALKFTHTNGKVEIKLYADKENIIVEVKDNGIGIRKEDLPFIFERLYRGDKSRNQIDGSGIGLTIVKGILQLHNATMEVDSEEERGTVFKIYFNA